MPRDAALATLETYAYWLAKGAPVGTKLPGQGFLPDSMYGCSVNGRMLGAP
ncbi:MULTISPECIES: hypothetical protein [Burkholderia]|uniref:hypothetical protein n=1 Tax=Burkholderia TaxID=32008 RepID=UPI0003FFDB2C|nr:MULTISPECIES: hypothetical protein [Burkholderia]